jgi:hypothetical protein
MGFSAFQFSSILGCLLAVWLSGSVPSSVHAAETALEGWDQYKFGMTPDQVRAIPGITWDEPKANSYPPTASQPQNNPQILPPNEFIASTMRSSSAVNKYGFEFSVTALFDAQMTLNEIYSQHYSEGQSPEECEQQFQKLLEVFEMRYGAFVPGYNPVEHDQRGNADVTAVWRDLLGAKSRYAFLTFEKRRVGTDKDVSYAAGAIHVFGPSSVQVSFVYFPFVSKSSCSVFFYFFR